MILTAAVTVLALISSAALALAGAGVPAAVAHLAFAVGIVPLIFAAMSHFVAVLTRSGGPSRSIAAIPPLAQAAGLAAIVAMQGWLPRWVLHAAASADLLLASALLVWIVGRARRCLGQPHPGWRWYGAALGCLLLALAAVLGMAVRPGDYAIWRGLHLHLNTLGLVGLAAFGTLPVLLPTALGKGDPQAAGWLRRRLWPFVAGAVLVAAGAALPAWPPAAAGAALLAWAVAGLLRQWAGQFGLRALLADGVAASLLAAAAGFIALLFFGLLHGVGALAGRPAIAGWGAAFLLPLVTGALSQLLPVWRWPGPKRPARGLMRTALAATGRWRAGLFLAGGLLLAVDFSLPGGLLAAGGLALFAAALVRALRVPG